MSKSIEELLKNNHAPPEQAVQEVRGLLLKPLKELADLDMEIINLRNRLVELENRRTKLQGQIERYQPILSPIRRLPFDVLGEIFYRCLPTHRNPIMASTDCPLLLTRVCSPWRDAAIRTPKLWDRLYITFTDEDTVPDLETLCEMAQRGEATNGWPCALSRADKQNTTEILRRKFEAFKEWILRSGKRSLSISLYITTISWCTIPYLQRAPSVTMEFLSFLASLAPRWKEFEFKSQMTLYKALEEMLPDVSQMTSLKSVRLHTYSLLVPHIADNTQPRIRLLTAPNLRTVVLHGIPANKMWGSINRPLAQWNKLTHISCCTEVSLLEVTFMLELSPNLLYFKARLTLSQMGTIPNVPTLHKGRISLLFLRGLSISESFQPNLGIDMYQRIDAPQLQSIIYSSQYNTGTQGYSADNPVSIPILPLLRQSTELHYLSINVNDVDAWDITTMLREAPSVTDLVIGLEEMYLMRSRSPVIMNYNSERKSSWNFRQLVADSAFPLLPRLTSFLITSPSASLSDDTLYEIIQSRMVSGTTAALRRAKALLHWQKKERDITGELAQYAELMGVEMIDLDLVYPLPPPDVVKKHTDPKFGLVGEDGTPWPSEEEAGEITYRWHRGKKVP